MNESVKELLKDVRGVVEATSFEKYSLWMQYNNSAPANGFRKLKWDDCRWGVGVRIGELGDKPIFVSLLTTEIEDYKILFYEATSVVVDHDMVRRWIEANMPPSAFDRYGRLNHADAGNFINVIHSIQIEDEGIRR